jgi:redox-sensitive bicupin YhaK (pirin superfamily)
MFPLLNADKRNTLEIFQIWLNLPQKNKRVEPHFSMLWADTTPEIELIDKAGLKAIVKVFAGNFNEHSAPAPAPNSWAANPANQVAIWRIELAAGAELTLPSVAGEANRRIYCYEGALAVANEQLNSGYGMELHANEAAVLKNADAGSKLLLLQGKPIKEKVVQHGPFVANSPEEINLIMAEFRKNQYGGWPWPSYENVHDKISSRFAQYPDGKVEKKPL